MNAQAANGAAITEALAPSRVLYLGGVGRSGSTILDLMLGQVPGFCAVGELSYLWTRKDDDLCGCGEPFTDCPFWKAVGEAAFGGWDSIDRARIQGMRRSLDRHRSVPTMLLVGGRRFRSRFGDYARIMERLYEGVRMASGSSVIVDSTKDPSTAFLLRRMAGVELSVVHLVRDSRGVAYSWTKRVRKPGVAGDAAFMDRFAPSRTAGRWLTYNGLFHVLRLAGTPSVRLRYEDLVRSPARELGRILAMLRMPPATFPFLRDEVLQVGTSHTIAGNPVRFGSQALPLAVDEAWRTELPTQSRRSVTAITAPLLFAYGYLGRRRGAHP